MKQRKAFTLIEVLIVICVISVLFIVLASRVDFATDKAFTMILKTLKQQFIQLH